jgi:membrane fusion protein, heavy metal efflux system
MVVTPLRVAGIVFAACIAASCGDKESHETTGRPAAAQRLRPDGSIQLTDQDRTALGLVVAGATEADVPDTTLRFGRVTVPPGNEAQIVAPVTGRIIRAPRVQLGAAVKAGAPVLEIEPSLDTVDRISVNTQSAERAGQIEAAERELVRAEAEAARTRELTPHVTSVAKLQEAETAVATARAHLEGLRNAQASSNRAQTQLVQVTAPIGGIVSTLTAEVGALANKGDVLARVMSGGPVWVDVSVPPDEPVGDGYTIDVAGKSVSARLLARGSTTDADGTRHDRVVVAPADAGTLTPNASVPVHVAHGASRGFVVPETALVPGVEGDTVFVETEPNLYAPRAVDVAARLAGRVRIRSGLKPGERVVVQGVMALQGERLRSQLRNVEQ